MIYDSPLYSPEDNLQIAMGGIEFRDTVIENLREQIRNLRELALEHNEPERVDYLQYKHLRV